MKEIVDIVGIVCCTITFLAFQYWFFKSDK